MTDAIPTIHVKQRCWRMLAPKWAFLPLSGEGAALHGGRFNEPGRQALYVSEDYITAISEYQQDLGIRPGTLCAYDLDIQGIVDLTDSQILSALAIADGVLSCPWKEIAFVRRERPPTWDLAKRLINSGVAGIRVPSMQRVTGVNLVLWHWNDDPTRKIQALDPRSDLPLNQSSWT